MVEGWGLGEWIRLTVYVVLIAQVLAFLLKPWILKRGSLTQLPPGKLTIYWDDTIQYLKSMTDFRNTGKWIDERRARYGNIFKSRVFLERTVFALGSKANRFVLSNDTKLFGNHWPKTMRDLVGTSSILVVNGEQHRRIRPYMEQFLGYDAMKRFMSNIEECILSFVDRCQQEDVVKINSKLRCLLFEIVFQFILGGSKDVDVGKLEKDFLELGLNLVCLPINLPWTQYGKGLRARSAIYEVIYSEIRKRRVEWDAGVSPLGKGGRLSPHNIEVARDMLDLFMFWEVNPDSGKEWEFTDVEIAQNILVALLASQGTTSSSITSILYHLANRPHIIQELRKECATIRETKKPAEPITWSDIKKLQYMRKVIYESLRLHTTVGQISKQTLCDVEFEGYTIPKGWVVTLSGRQTHMKEENFPLPDDFDPSRFNKNPDLYSFIAFGRGPRMCPGEKFAMVLMQIFLYHFIPRFDYELVNPDEEFIMFFGPVPKQGLPLKLKPAAATS